MAGHAHECAVAPRGWYLKLLIVDALRAWMEVQDRERHRESPLRLRGEPPPWFLRRALMI